MIKPLFDVFRDSLMRKPTASRKEAQDHFVAQMKSDTAYLELLARDYFDRMAATWTVRTEKHGGYSFARTDVAADKAARTGATLRGESQGVSPAQKLEQARKARAESAARTSSAREGLKASLRSIILLDLELPNGKRLRQATGSDCTKAGGFYAEVGKLIKPSQIVDRHLSESDLQNIRTRYFQRNADAANAA